MAVSSLLSPSSQMVLSSPVSRWGHHYPPHRGTQAQLGLSVKPRL